MGRKKRKVSAGKRKINECYHDDLPAQSSDDKNAGEKGVSNKAITDDQSSQEKSSMDSFYEKLIKLHESSGLSIIFDFRATKVDLYLIYKEVTERGGSYQVSKDGKWIEVASALSIKNHASFLPSQIQKVYENLLCQFEQIHYYRSPAKASTLTDLCLGKGDSLEFFVGKHKSCDSSSRHDHLEKRKCTAGNYRSSKGPGTPELKPTLQTALNEKTITRGPCAPPKAKTSYQLFLKMECEQLKKIHGERSSSLNLREMAIATWRKLSQNDRLPYIEASQKDKERFNREMAVYMQHKNKKVMKTENLLAGTTSTLINFVPSSPIHDDDYYVTLEADAGNFFLPDESLVESTIEMLKNARPNDPIFQINWDGCCGSTDSPN